MSTARAVFRLTQLVALVAIFTVILAACAPAATPTPAAQPTEAAKPTAAAASQAASGPTIDRIKQAGKLVVLMDATFRPMEFKNEKGEIVGADVEIANALANELGVKLEIANTNWDSIFASLTSGKGDVIISSVTITEDRKKEMLFSTPYYAAGQLIVVKKDNDTIKGPDDLKGKVVGVQIDTTGQEAVEKLEGIKEIKKYDGGAETMLAVDTGKVEAGVIDAMVALDYVNQHDTVKVVDRTPFTKEEIGIAIAKENEDLQAFVNEFVEKIKADGSLDTMLGKYGLK